MDATRYFALDSPALGAARQSTCAVHRFGCRRADVRAAQEIEEAMRTLSKRGASKAHNNLFSRTNLLHDQLRRVQWRARPQLYARRIQPCTNLDWRKH